MFNEPAQLISGILKHDRKTNSYKFALLRAINDIVLSFLDVDPDGRDVAVPLRLIAELWFAYYFPFVDEEKPIFQGNRSARDGTVRNDMGFRPALTAFRRQWRALYGDNPGDGFWIINQMRRSRGKADYPANLIDSYSQTLSAIIKAVQQPIRYAGPGEWTIFPRPIRAKQAVNALLLPATHEDELCLLISASLWEGFKQYSLWIEALCVHEWSLYVSRVLQNGDRVERGTVYTLLTARPDNRCPLTWERNQIQILLLEGRHFTCPWTHKRLLHLDDIDIDHIIPIAIYPSNELWNLVPADRQFNQHIKRDRLPKTERLQAARPHLVNIYAHYHASNALKPVLLEDISLRFGGVRYDQLPDSLSDSVIRFVSALRETRNLAEF